MVELYSDHPARLSDGLRNKLSKLSFGSQGYMKDYILNVYHDLWKLQDRVIWLERNGVPFAWCVRATDYPYCDPAFMVFVQSKERRKKWGTFLYHYATRHTTKKYEVYGTHTKTAAKFYTRLGREDYS